MLEAVRAAVNARTGTDSITRPCRSPQITLMPIMPYKLLDSVEVDNAAAPSRPILLWVVVCPSARSIHNRP